MMLVTRISHTEHGRDENAKLTIGSKLERVTRYEAR